MSYSGREGDEAIDAAITGIYGVPLRYNPNNQDLSRGLSTTGVDEMDITEEAQLMAAIYGMNNSGLSGMDPEGSLGMEASRPLRISDTASDLFVHDEESVMGMNLASSHTMMDPRQRDDDAFVFPGPLGCLDQDQLAESELSPNTLEMLHTVSTASTKKRDRAPSDESAGESSAPIARKKSKSVSARSAVDASNGIPVNPGPTKTKKNKERVRAAPISGTIASLKAIPRSFQECDDADKALISMRDAGQPWADVKARVSAITGHKYGHSSLPNRYERLKANFVIIREEDNVLMMEAKKEIEAEDEETKWARIAQRVSEKHGGDYEGTDLQRHYKKLMAVQGFNIKQGLARQDVDFEESEDDDPEQEEDSMEQEEDFMDEEGDSPEHGEDGPQYEQD